jgi:hypothetical protein
MRPGLKFLLPEPIARYGYIDQIQFWLIDPLKQHTLDLLKAECGKGGLHVSNKRAQFNRRFRQRVQLRQPTEKALRLLAQRNDVLINAVEISLDLVFKYWSEKSRALAFLHQHLIRRWHGSRQPIHVTKADGDIQYRFDARRSAPNKIALYPEDFTRVTGELHGLHIEWRAKGVRATRAAGISSHRDLLVFDYRGFWQKRLLFYDIDRRMLGLMIRNRSTGRRHRTHEKTIKRGRFGYDTNGSTGEHYAQKYETVQELIHRIKPFCRIHRALTPISNEMLLPL